MKKVFWIAMLITALALTSIARAAETVGPEAFYGRYHGTGIAQDAHALTLGFDQRDFDVEIGPANGGFFVAWTTVIVTQSMRGKNVRRTSTRIVFEPSGRPGIYVQQAAATEIANGLSWASISGRALTVRVVAILDDGKYEIQTYERTLTKDGVRLLFRSDRNGSASKIVTAYSKKQAQ
jgi:hypothetical protein